MLLVALGAGWASNQEGRWPFLGWFAPYAEHEAEAVVQPIAEPQKTPEPAPLAVAAADQQPEIEHTADAPQPGQETAPDQAMAAPPDGAPLAPASPTAPGDAVNPSASNQAAAQDSAGSVTRTEGPSADGSAAREASSSETQAAGAPPVGDGGTVSAEAPDAAAEPEATAGQRGVAAIPPAGDPQALGDATGATGGEPQATAAMIGNPEAESGSTSPSSGATGDAAQSRVAAEMTDNPDALPGTESGSIAPSGEDAAEVAGTVPGDGREPGLDDASAGAAGDDPAQEVAALLSDAKTTAPSFDIVRIEPDGHAVIAGRAAPGAEVELRSGEEVIDRVRASRRGEWVAIPGKPLSPGDQQLSAVMAQKDAPAVASEQIVVVAVPERALPVASQASVAAPQPPVAVLLPRTGRGTGRILQAPGRLSARGTLALITVGYDQLGQMLLSGEAPPGVPVRVYVDNQPMALVVGDAKGTWSSGLDGPLEPGTYTLRLDQLDAQGQTVARIETPITRVSEPPIEGELQVDYVVVQPGNSLWRIARRLTGKGVDYVYIYDSNQAQIRDPDLIFPGQVFQIPAEVGTAG